MKIYTVRKPTKRAHCHKKLLETFSDILQSPQSVAITKSPENSVGKPFIITSFVKLNKRRVAL